MMLPGICARGWGIVGILRAFGCQLSAVRHSGLDAIRRSLEAER